jgi:hypothetical protein
MTTLVGVAAGAIVALVTLVRRRRLASAPPARGPVELPSLVETPPDPAADSSLARGVRDIRRTDPRFDPSRFAGYAAMMYRDTQSARAARNVDPLRDRVTPEMYGRLRAQCDRLRDTGQASRLERIEILAEVTNAWQESGQDYVTTSVGGSLVDYTIDEASGRLVAGSRTTPTAGQRILDVHASGGPQLLDAGRHPHLVTTTVLDPDLQARIREILEIQLADTVKARRLLPDGTSERLPPIGGRALRSQQRHYEVTGADGPWA